MTQIIISTNEGLVLPIKPNQVAVVYAPDNATITEMLDDPADNPRMSVADAYEQLTFDDGHDMPMIDDIVAAGMTPPEPGEFIEWADIARHLQERLDQAKQMARELYSDSHTLSEFLKGAI